MSGRVKYALSIGLVAIVGFAAAMSAPALFSRNRVSLSDAGGQASTTLKKNELHSLAKSLKNEQELRRILEGQQAGFIEEIARLKQQLRSSSASSGEQSGEAQDKTYGGDLRLAPSEREKGLEEDISKLKDSLESAENSRRGELVDAANKVSLLQTKLSEADSELSRCESQLAAQADLQAGLEKQTKEFQDVSSLLAGKDRALQACNTHLESSNKRLLRVDELEKDLLEAKNELLLLREMEQDFLRGADSTLSARKRESFREKTSRARRSEPKVAPEVPVVRGGLAPHQATGASSSEKGSLVIEVTRSKINLRSGPGREHSPVMQVRKGSRLLVEDREGDWYRVITPTGTRAYVKRDVVRTLSGGSAAQLYGETQGERGSLKAPAKPAARVGNNDQSLVPFGKVKLGGRSPDPDAVAVERLKRMLQSKEEGGSK